MKTTINKSSSINKIDYDESNNKTKWTNNFKSTIYKYLNDKDAKKIYLTPIQKEGKTFYKVFHMTGKEMKFINTIKASTCTDIWEYMEPFKYFNSLLKLQSRFFSTDSWDVSILIWFKHKIDKREREEESKREISWFEREDKIAKEEELQKEVKEDLNGFWFESMRNLILA